MQNYQSVKTYTKLVGWGKWRTSCAGAKAENKQKPLQLFFCKTVWLFNIDVTRRLHSTIIFTQRFWFFPTSSNFVFSVCAGGLLWNVLESCFAYSGPISQRIEVSSDGPATKAGGCPIASHESSPKFYCFIFVLLWYITWKKLAMIPSKCWNLTRQVVAIFNLILLFTLTLMFPPFFDSSHWRIVFIISSPNILPNFSHCSHNAPRHSLASKQARNKETNRLRLARTVLQVRLVFTLKLKQLCFMRRSRGLCPRKRKSWCLTGGIGWGCSSRSRTNRSPSCSGRGGRE